MKVRPGLSDGPAYTPIVSIPWWDWNDPSEGGDGLPDGDGHQYWDDEDDEDEEYEDEDGENEDEDGENEDGNGDWETDDENEGGNGYSDGYEVGDGGEHGDGYEQGNDGEDDDQCDCNCDWWWTDDEDNSGEGVDWEWVTEDVVSWEEEGGACNWRPISTPTLTPPRVSDTPAQGYDTGPMVPPPESMTSLGLNAGTSSDDSDSTSDHGYYAHHAAPGSDSQHDKPQSWHDGILSTGLRYSENGPNNEWSDGALHRA